MKENMWCLCLWAPVTVVSIIFPVPLIQLQILVFFTAKWNSIGYMDHIFITHSLVKGHTDWFHSLAIVNRTKVNMGEQVLLQQDMKFFRYMLCRGIAESHGRTIPAFWGHSTLISTVAASAVNKGFSFPHPLGQLLPFFKYYFNPDHSDQGRLKTNNNNNKNKNKTSEQLSFVFP